eukprot:3713818-Pyramimonas_sp.AAC.1
MVPLLTKGLIDTKTRHAHLNHRAILLSTSYQFVSNSNGREEKFCKRAFEILVLRSRTLEMSSVVRKYETTPNGISNGACRVKPSLGVAERVTNANSQSSYLDDEMLKVRRTNLYSPEQQAP